MIEKNDVIQFTENHEWCGCLGIVEETKICRSERLDYDTRYMIGVPIPKQGTAFIYVMESEKAIEKIGKAVLAMKDGEDDE